MLPVSEGLKRLVAVSILVGWQVPGVFALGVGLILAGQHQGTHAGEPEHDMAALADLARSATHGHHHDHEAVPDHSHDATLDARVEVPLPGLSAIGVLAVPASPQPAHAEEAPFDAASRRGPPTLFRTHCALLL